MFVISVRMYFKAGKTHEIGKSGHPGDDGAALAVVAPAERRWQSITGRDDDDDDGHRWWFRRQPVVVGRGPDGGGRAKVPDGLPRVRGRGEPVRRPAGRRRPRYQEAADVAFGLVRGQNEMRSRRYGFRHGAAAHVRKQLSAVAAPATLRPGRCSAPDAHERSAAVAPYRGHDRRPRSVGDSGTRHTASTPSTTGGEAFPGDERFYRGAPSPGPVAGRRRPAVVRRVLRRTGRDVDQLVGRRRCRRDRCGRQESTARFLDEKKDGVVPQQEAPGRHTGKRSYGGRLRRYRHGRGGLRLTQNRFGGAR